MNRFSLVGARRTLTALDPKMTATTRQFWLVLLAARAFRLNPIRIAKATHLTVPIVDKIIERLDTLGFVKGGRVVGGYTNYFTNTYLIGGNVRSIVGKKRAASVIRTRVAA
jgi:hypothetical protein